MSSYQLLLRLLKEQCSVERDPETQASKVSIKPNKDVASDSLQNPSDPDASYDGHKGQGFQMQVAETFCPDQEKKFLSLITAVSVEPDHQSDSDALIPLIEATQKRGLGPNKALADSLYGSDENCERAKELGVEVVSPVMGNPPGDHFVLTDFILNQGGTIIACPQGHAPVKVKHKKGKHVAIFDLESCAGCPHLSHCPVEAGKKGHSLRYDDKALRLARRRAHEKTREFQEEYRFRSGIEGTMSQLDRKTGVKHLRVRGLAAVSFCATLKAAGINILRAVVFKNSELPGNSALKQKYLGLFDPIYAFKERFANTLTAVANEMINSFRFKPFDSMKLVS